MTKFIILPTSDVNPVTVPFLLSPKGKLVKHFAGGQFRKMISLGYKPQHLFLVLDEKPTFGELYVSFDVNNKPRSVEVANFDKTNEWNIEPYSKYCKRVIASTDLRLELREISQKDIQTLITTYNSQIELNDEVDSMADLRNFMGPIVNYFQIKKLNSQDLKNIEL
jgi:hypothetical protein